jgi:hypothetical protein
VEEVTKLFSLPENSHQHEPKDEHHLVNQPTEKQSTIRELFNGFEKGYWGTLQNPIVKERHPSESNHDSPVEIKLDIPIPKDVTPTPKVSLSNYTSEPIPAQFLPSSLHGQFSPTTPESLITVEHRLRFDLLTSEATFDVDNRNLVDRKALRNVLNVSFPLHLFHERAPGRIDETVCKGNPPCYEEVPLSPPDYQVFA